MRAPIRFTLDGAHVEAQPGETIWQVAQRQGTHIPHLCHRDAHGGMAGVGVGCIVGARKAIFRQA